MPKQSIIVFIIIALVGGIVIGKTFYPRTETKKEISVIEKIQKIYSPIQGICEKKGGVYMPVSSKKTDEWVSFNGKFADTYEYDYAQATCLSGGNEFKWDVEKNKFVTSKEISL